MHPYCFRCCIYHTGGMCYVCVCIYIYIYIYTYISKSDMCVVHVITDRYAATSPRYQLPLLRLLRCDCAEKSPRARRATERP